MPFKREGSRPSVFISEGRRGSLYFGDEPWGTYLPLFVVWQALVAASVAYGLVVPPQR